ncbi:hypothetical protein ABVK25_011881 [Lepraria finkii]|uniref:Uncharacterized protein n=1 Tax=Lepraria finkii TaxID=1340010 RepID=A0ABR4AMQ2_9LECA
MSVRDHGQESVSETENGAQHSITIKPAEVEGKSSLWHLERRYITSPPSLTSCTLSGFSQRMISTHSFFQTQYLGSPLHSRNVFSQAIHNICTSTPCFSVYPSFSSLTGLMS